MVAGARNRRHHRRPSLRIPPIIISIECSVADRLANGDFVPVAPTPTPHVEGSQSAEIEKNDLEQRLTLNQRLQGSSPCAPTAETLRDAFA
jgi:hypothetical protein